MNELHALYGLVAVVFGLSLGSFWNVAISRWPDGRSVVRPRSQCPSCSSPVVATDNIPVVSWMLLRGKCRTCAWPIPATYPLTELLGGIVGFLTYRRFVPTPADVDLPHLAAAVLYFGFASALLIGAFVDARHKIIPDEVTLGALPVGLLGAGLLETLGYTGWLALGWRGAVLGALAGGVFFGTIALAAYAATGREALGIGDVKLLAMIGAFLGPHPAIFTICMAASLTGSLIAIVVTIVTQRRMYMPFGPVLAFWSLAYLFYGDILLAAWFPMLSGAATPIWLPI